MQDLHSLYSSPEGQYHHPLDPLNPGPQSGSKEPLHFPLLNYLWILYNKVSAYYKEKQRSAASFIEERRKPCILLIRMM